MSSEGFEKFREVVLNDPYLQAELGAIADVEGFTACVVELAEKHGHSFDASDVMEAINAGRRALIEQWI